MVSLRPSTAADRYTGLLLLLLFLVTAALRFHALGKPDTYYFDEIYFAFTAQQLAAGNTEVWDPWAKAPEGFSYEWTHPPLGKLILSLGIKAMGDPDDPFTWRVMPAAFGSLGVLLLYLLAWELFRSRASALLAAFFYTFDTFPLVMSRIATTDIFIMDFILLASFSVARFARSENRRWLLLGGLSAGAAASVKWSGVYAVEFLALCSLILLVRRRLAGGPSPEEPGVYVREGLRVLPLAALFFIVVPLAVYLLSYVPYFASGYGWKDFVALHEQMYGYHKGVHELHAYRSSWWSWPLMLRPVYFYLGEKAKDVHAHIYTFGNPFLWWSSCVLFVAAAYEAYRREDPALGFVVLSVLAYWIPWALSPRKITFIYHFLPSLPFMYLATARMLHRLWRRGRSGRAVVVSFLVLTLAFFVYFYPVAAAVPLKDSSLPRWFWLRRWR